MTALIVQLGDRSNLSADFLFQSRPALGKDSQDFIALSKEVLRTKTPSTSFEFFQQDKSSAKSIEENLFEASANVKILTSRVAMHMKNEWRDKLFKQIDSLHDIDEWVSEDRPINDSSFFNFLRAMLSINPERLPSLGLSNSGNLIAAWINDDDRLTLEFLPDARVRWVLVNHNELGADRFAGNVNINRLAVSLTPYNPERWFNNEN